MQLSVISYQLSDVSFQFTDYCLLFTVHCSLKIHPTPHSLEPVYVSRGRGCDKLIKGRLSPSNYDGVTR
ncbi:MAG: hypothetical protein EWV60_02220 [Microcystis sp. Msp_OC_L_20101000_S702]|nr:MAG: hypothetical protein EWV60_02220 [Microcystis sp. Msp_OC_L_20101000_S702]